MKQFIEEGADVNAETTARNVFIGSIAGTNILGAATVAYDDDPQVRRIPNDC